jgi:hypothetical protein
VPPVKAPAADTKPNPAIKSASATKAQAKPVPAKSDEIDPSTLNADGLVKGADVSPDDVIRIARQQSHQRFLDRKKAELAAASTAK